MICARGEVLALSIEVHVIAESAPVVDVTTELDALMFWNRSATLGSLEAMHEGRCWR